MPEDQLSLAIGKDGQNVRLAAKLTGWKIDVRSPEQAGGPMAVEEPTEPKEEVKEEKPKKKPTLRPRSGLRLRDSGVRPEDSAPSDSRRLMVSKTEPPKTKKE